MLDDKTKPVNIVTHVAAPGEDVHAPGEVIGSRYRVLSCIGRGGMGVVYKVEQIFLGEQLALKTLINQNATDTSIRRFQQEGKATFSLDHPNIVSVSDFGLLDDGSPFLVMAFVEGKTLAEHLREQGPMSVSDAAKVFARICLGLSYAHSKGLIHRDIKPSNIMLTGRALDEEECVKVLDFGIAKLMQGHLHGVQSLTRTGEIFGSPLYMSPEQCAGLSVDHRSDVYSLGCVLFECLTGAPPFLGETALATMSQHQSKTPPSLADASLGKDFPDSLESLVCSMLAKSPDDRHQSLGQIAHDLAAIARSDDTAIVQPGTTSRKKQVVKNTDANATVVVGKKTLYGLVLGLACLLMIASYCLVKMSAVVPIVKDTPASIVSINVVPGQGADLPVDKPKDTPKLRTLNALVANQPNNPEAYLKRAEYFYQSDCLRSALKDCQQSIGLRPTAQAYLIMGDAEYLQDPTKDRGRAAYATALTLAGTDVNVLSELANRFNKIQMHKEEAATYRKALQLRPNDLNIKSWLAWALAQAGSYDEAISVSSQVLESPLMKEIARNNASSNKASAENCQRLARFCFQARGNSYAGLNKPDAALADFDAALKIPSDQTSTYRVDILTARAKLYTKTRRQDLANLDLKQISERKSNGISLIIDPITQSDNSR